MRAPASLQNFAAATNFLGVARAGREDADGVLGERLMPHDHELGSDDGVRLDLVGRGLQPVHHRQRVGVGAAAADEKQVGIALRANLVDCLFNLRTQRDGAVDQPRCSDSDQYHTCSNSSKFYKIRSNRVRSPAYSAPQHEPVPRYDCSIAWCGFFVNRKVQNNSFLFKINERIEKKLEK